MKYKRLAVLAMALCLVLPLAACSLKPAGPWPEALKPGRRLIQGSGNVVEVKTQLPDAGRGFALRVNGITLQNSKTDVELVIDESLAREVVLTADDNIAECISVDFDAGPGQIVIDLTRRVVFTPTKLTIAVGAPVRALDVNGAWRFTYNCPSVKECEVSIDGAANGDFTFGALDTLALTLNGTGNIKLAGTAKQAELRIDGAANIRAFDLTAESAEVTINGTGNCDITATKALFADINGLGKVVYGGNPPDVDYDIDGLGKVEARRN